MSKLTKAIGKSIQKGLNADFSLHGIIDTIRSPMAPGTGGPSTPRARGASTSNAQSSFGNASGSGGTGVMVVGQKDNLNIPVERDSNFSESNSVNETTCSMIYVLGKLNF
jgi:hypothetical protein